MLYFAFISSMVNNKFVGILFSCKTHLFCSYTDLMCFLNMGNNNIERMNGRDEGIREIGNWLRMDNK